MLLDKHPDVNAVFCSVEEIENRSALTQRKEGVPNWYLVHKPEDGRYPESNKGFWDFVHCMPKEDRIFVAVDGLIPESFLELIWDGVMAAVMPETFWFTEAETYRYLRECRSELRYREVYYLTGGWAGCIAMLVRLEQQLTDRWTAWELSSRYEIRRYIQNYILNVLPGDELRMLRERAAFPSLNAELVSLLWKDPDKELEERLFVRGALIYVPESDTWHVQSALRTAMDEFTSAELCEKAIAWYEKEGQIAIRPITRKECELNLYPKDSLYKLTVGKGYARVTNKSVCAQIQQLFSCRLDNMKLPAVYDDNENLLIAEFSKRGDEV